MADPLSDSNPWFSGAQTTGADPLSGVADPLSDSWFSGSTEQSQETAYHRAGQAAAEWRKKYTPAGWLSSLDEGEAERGLIPGFYGSTARGMGQMVGDIASAVEAAGGPGGVGAGTADFFEGFLSDPSLRRSESVDRPEGEWDWMTNWRFWTERGTETASQFVVQLGAALLTGNPAMMIAPQMLQEAGGTYKEEQRRHLRDGLGEEEAHERAATTAALNGIGVGLLNTIPGMHFTGNLKSLGATRMMSYLRSKLGHRGADALTGIMMEGTQENLEHVYSEALLRYQADHPDTDLSPVSSEAIQSFALGGLLGGGAGVALSPSGGPDGGAPPVAEEPTPEPPTGPGAGPGAGPELGPPTGPVPTPSPGPAPEPTPVTETPVEPSPIQLPSITLRGREVSIAEIVEKTVVSGQVPSRKTVEQLKKIGVIPEDAPVGTGKQRTAAVLNIKAEDIQALPAAEAPEPTVSEKWEEKGREDFDKKKKRKKKDPKKDHRVYKREVDKIRLDEGDEAAQAYKRGWEGAELAEREAAPEAPATAAPGEAAPAPAGELGANRPGASPGQEANLDRPYTQQELEDRRDAAKDEFNRINQEHRTPDPSDPRVMLPPPRGTHERERLEVAKHERSVATEAARRGDNDQHIPVLRETDTGGTTLHGKEAAEADVAIEGEIQAGGTAKEVLLRIRKLGYIFNINAGRPLARFIRDRLDPNIPEVGNNKSPFAQWRRGESAAPGEAAPAAPAPEAPRADTPVVVRGHESRTESESIRGPLGTFPQLTQEGSAYRGMTQEEYNATVGAGRGIESTGKWSASEEGTSFAKTFGDAEDYANVGRTDPRETGEPTYVVEVSDAASLEPGLGVGQSDYLRSPPGAMVPRDRITRVWEMRGVGDKITAREIPVEARVPAEDPVQKQLEALTEEELAGFANALGVGVRKGTKNRKAKLVERLRGKIKEIGDDRVEIPEPVSAKEIPEDNFTRDMNGETLRSVADSMGVKDAATRPLEEVRAELAASMPNATTSPPVATQAPAEEGAPPVEPARAAQAEPVRTAEEQVRVDAAEALGANVEDVVPVYRGTDDAGGEGLKVTEGGVRGDGIYFYTSRKPAESHVTGGGRVIAGFVNKNDPAVEIGAEHQNVIGPGSYSPAGYSTVVVRDAKSVYVPQEFPPARAAQESPLDAFDRVRGRHEELDSAIDEITTDLETIRGTKMHAYEAELISYPDDALLRMRAGLAAMVSSLDSNLYLARIKRNLGGAISNLRVESHSQHDPELADALQEVLDAVEGGRVMTAKDFRAQQPARAAQPRPEPTEAAAEPWQMTRDEYANWKRKPYSGDKAGLEGLSAKELLERQEKYLLSNASLRNGLEDDARGKGTRHEYDGPIGDEVTLYRVVPEGSTNQIYPGDYATLSRDYAEDHLSSHQTGRYVENKELVEGGTLLSKTVPTDEVTLIANNELAWSPKDPHRATIETAIADGKPVPANVLAEYPDLAQQPARSAEPRPEPTEAAPGEPITPEQEEAIAAEQEAAWQEEHGEAVAKYEAVIDKMVEERIEEINEHYDAWYDQAETLLGLSPVKTTVTSGGKTRPKTKGEMDQARDRAVNAEIARINKILNPEKGLEGDETNIKSFDETFMQFSGKWDDDRSSVKDDFSALGAAENADALLHLLLNPPKKIVTKPPRRLPPPKNKRGKVVAVDKLNNKELVDYASKLGFKKPKEITPASIRKLRGKVFGKLSRNEDAIAKHGEAMADVRQDVYSNGTKTTPPPRGYEDFVESTLEVVPVANKDLPPDQRFQVTDRRGVSEHPVSIENVRAAFPGARVTPLQGGGGWRVDIGGGRSLLVRLVETIVLDRAAAENQMGRKLTDEEFATMGAGGSFVIIGEDGTAIDGVGLVQLSKTMTDKTLRHESVHVARQLGLWTEAEWDALVKEYSDPEKSSRAQEEDVAIALEGKTVRHSFWKSIKRFFDRILGNMGLRGMSADTATALLESEAFWQRPLKEMGGRRFSYQLQPRHWRALFSEGRIPQEGDTLEEAVAGVRMTKMERSLANDLLDILSKQEKGIPKLRIDPRRAEDVPFSGAYQYSEHMIELPRRNISQRRMPHILIHEMVHAATRPAVGIARRPYYQGKFPTTARAEEAYSRLYQIRDYLTSYGAFGYKRDHLRPEFMPSDTSQDMEVFRYGFRSELEMMSEALANARFRKHLSKHKVPRNTKFVHLRGKTLLESFIESIKGLLGIKKAKSVTALEEIMGLTTTIMEEDIPDSPSYQMQRPPENDPANISPDQDVRDLVDQIRDHRDRTEPRVRRPDDVVKREAEEILNADRQKVGDGLIEEASQIAGEEPKDSLTAARQNFLADEAIDSIRTADPARREDLRRYLGAWDDIGATWGRVGRQRQDPLSPEKRNALKIGEGLNKNTDALEKTIKKLRLQIRKMKDRIAQLEAKEGLGPGLGPGAGPGLGPGQGPGAGPGLGPGTGSGLSAEEAAELQQLRDDIVLAEKSMKKYHAKTEELYQRILRELLRLGYPQSEEGGLDIDELVRNPRDAARVIGIISSYKAKFSDKAYEFWQNSILSALTTTGADVISSGAFNTYNVLVKRGMEALLFNTFTTTRNAATWSEFRRILEYALPGMSAGLRNATEAYKTEKQIFNESKGIEESLRFEHTGPSIGRGNIVGRGIARAVNTILPWESGKDDDFGRMVRGMGWRRLMFVDEGMKTLIYHLEAAAMAERNGRQLGYEGERLDKFVSDQVKDPESSAGMWGVEQALRGQFQFEGSKLTKEIVRHGIGAKNLPYVGHAVKFIAPFVKTPVHIAATGIEESLLGSLTLAHKWRKATSKNATLAERNDAAQAFRSTSQQFIALSAVLSLLFLNDEDDPWITGSVAEFEAGRRHEAERTYGAQTIRVGGMQFSYKRVEPFATALAMTVDVVNAIKSGSSMRVINDSMGSLVGAVKEKSYLRGISDVIKISEYQNKAEGVARWTSSFAASWIPNIARHAMRAGRTEKPERRIFADEEDFFKMAFQRTLQRTELGVVEDVPKYDLWGRTSPESSVDSPVFDIPLRLVSPVYVKEDDVFVGDKVLLIWNTKEAYAAKAKTYRPKAPSPRYTHDGKELVMTPEQYQDYSLLAGTIAMELVDLQEWDLEDVTQGDVDRITESIKTARATAKNLLKGQWFDGRPIRQSAQELGRTLYNKRKRRAIRDLNANWPEPGLNYRQRVEDMKRRKHEAADWLETNA